MTTPLDREEPRASCAVAGVVAILLSLVCWLALVALTALVWKLVVG